MNDRDIETVANLIRQFWPRSNWTAAEWTLLTGDFAKYRISADQAIAIVEEVKRTTTYPSKVFAELTSRMRAAHRSELTASGHFHVATPSGRNDRYAQLRNRWVSEGNHAAAGWNDIQTVHAEHHFIRVHAMMVHGPAYCKNFAKAWAVQMTADLCMAGMSLDNAVAAALDANGITDEIDNYQQKGTHASQP
jgi:hypothetical protein